MVAGAPRRRASDGERRDAREEDLADAGVVALPNRGDLEQLHG